MRRFGELDAHVVGPDEGSGPTIVLLHGFGAPGTDLVPLARELSAPGMGRFVFLEAPLEMPTPFGLGRAWWMIDPMRFQAALALGRFEEIEREEPVGLVEARRALSGALDAIEAQLRPAPLVLGGFSQGSMLALDLTLAEPKRSVAGLVLLSSTLLAAERWRAALPGRTGLPVVLSHGRHDPILPFVQAQRLRGLMEEAGWDVTWVPFDGQHEIPSPVLAEARAFLRRICGVDAKPR